MARYASFLMVGDHIREGLAAVEEALDLARRTGSRRFEGHAMNTKGALLSDVGRLEESFQLLRDAGAIARETGHLDDLVRAFVNLTTIQVFAGLADQALATAEEGLQLARQQGTMLSHGIAIAWYQALAAVRA